MAIILSEQGSERLRECVNFCNEHPVFWPSLLHALRYLNDYACNDGRRSRCYVHTDYAPLSFGFSLQVYRPGKHLLIKCTNNAESREEEYDERNHGCWWRDSVKPGHVPAVCPDCGAPVSVTPIGADDVQAFAFNGGIIFHGPHDNGGDGGAPTFSVNLTREHGWSIHT